MMNKKTEKACKHDFHCESFLSRDISTGMRCRKCRLERPFTSDEKAIFDMGRRRQRSQTWNTIQDRFHTILTVELQSPIGE